MVAPTKALESQLAKSVLASRRLGRELADFGVVGDLFKVVPQLIEEIGKRSAR